MVGTKPRADNRRRVKAQPKPTSTQMHPRWLGRSLDATPINPEAKSVRTCRRVSAIAMTSGFTTANCNEKGRLAASGNACIALSPGSVDSHHVAAVECSAKRNHGEASMGRQLGDQDEVTSAWSATSIHTAASQG